MNNNKKAKAKAKAKAKITKLFVLVGKYDDFKGDSEFSIFNSLEDAKACSVSGNFIMTVNVESVQKLEEETKKFLVKSSFEDLETAMEDEDED